MALTCAGFTPIEKSEIRVDGEFSPNHSSCREVGDAPSATGFVHISTNRRRTPSISLAVVIALVATNNKLSKFLRVIEKPPVLEPELNLNLWDKLIVGTYWGTRMLSIRCCAL
jgi:hypothetical protein